MKLFDFKAFVTLESANSCIELLKQEFEHGCGKAGYALALIFSRENTFIPGEIKRAIGVSDEKALAYQTESFGLLKQSAENGDGESMHLVASYYQCGMPPAARDHHLFGVWTEKAFRAGYVGALDNLVAIYADPKSEFHCAEKAEQLRRQL
jgi:hypothetical protein